MHEAIAAGLGIGFVFEHEIGQDDRVRAIRLSGVGEKICTIAACLENQSWRRVVQAFLEIAEEAGAA